ncbi:autotransporter domain-containing protein [Desulfovibrio piger]
MQLTKGAIGNLINRYKAVLKKCHLMNTFGSLAVAGMLVMGGAGVAGAEGSWTKPNGETEQWINGVVPNGTVLQGTYEGFSQGEKTLAGVATVDYTTTGVSVANGTTFTNNSKTAGAAGALKLLNGIKIGDNVTFTGNKAISNAWGGGAIYIKLANETHPSDNKLVTIGSNAKFANNQALTWGGAIALEYGNLTIDEGAIFEGNKTLEKNNRGEEGGGAIAVWHDPSNGNPGHTHLSVTKATFRQNRTNVSGGAIYNKDGDITITGSQFDQNSSGSMGGAIANMSGRTDYTGEINITDSGFTGNKAGNGGAVWNGTNGKVNITNSTFSKNTAMLEGHTLQQGGAITNGGEMTITGSTFDNNNANFGGAIWNEGTLTVNGGGFEDNTAKSAAGAIYNADGAKLTVDGVSFKENTAKFGGAINNAKTARDKEAAILTVKNSQFIGNTSLNSQGGAIRNQGIITEISGSTFKGNKASNGGAINNGEWGQIELITNSVFDGNEATLENTAAMDGGAILNRGTIQSIADSTFTNNKTSGAGGAILNKDGASLTFNGTNTFTNNTAASKANDIHNSGTITVASGTTTLGSGYSQDAGSLTVQGGAALESLGTMEISGGSVAFKDNSLFAVNGNSLTGDNAAITVDAGGTLAVDDKARLRIDNAKSGQTVNIVDGSSVTWKEIEAGTDLLTPTMDNNGDVTFSRDKDASEVFTGVDGNTAAMLNTLIDKGLNNVDSDQMGVRFLSRATDNHFLGADKDAAAATIESAARIAFAGAVPQMTKMASDAGTNAVVNRLGFANPADGAQAMDAEGKIVDRNTTGFALWIAPLWQSQHGWGMEAGNLDYGFNGNLGGVSLGADYTFENAIRAGITFNIGGGYAESSGGDLNSTENRMSFWGLGAYAGWNYENFGLMADVSYTSTWNDLQQDMDSRMGMGDLEADVQASAISAGLRAEYKLETSVLDVIPHIGVRYMSLNTWGFDAESNGGTVLEGDGFHQDIWTFPVGVTFTKDFTLDSGWSFKPSIDFSVIPAAGDIKAKQDVAFTGLPGTYEVETQMMDYLTWQGGVGLELGNDTMSFGVNYTLQAGQHTTGHGVFGSFRYEF